MNSTMELVRKSAQAYVHRRTSRDIHLQVPFEDKDQCMR